MAEDGHGRPESLEDLDLGGRVGDVILASDDMRDAERRVVSDGGQGIEIAAVLPDQDRIGQRARIDVARPADEILPSHLTRFQREAPMRAPALGFEPRPLLGRELERGAVIDRRQAARELEPAAALEFLARLVAGIEAARRLQPVRRRRIDLQPLRLPRHHVGHDPEPGEILLRRIGEGPPRALRIGIVEAEDEAAAGPAREERVEERGARIADMDEARR